MKIKSLFINFLSLLSIKGIDFLIPIIVFPIIINKLGLSDFGLFSLCFAISMYLSAFFQYGNNLIAVRKIATRSTNVETSRYIFTVYSSQFISFLMIISLLIVIYTFFDIEKGFDKLILLSFFLSVSESLVPSWLYQGKEKMKFLGFVGTTTKLFLVIYLVFFIKESDNYEDVVIGFIISSMSSFFMLIFYAIYSGWVNIEKVNAVMIINYYKEGFQSFLIQFSPTLYTSSVLIVLSYYTSSEQVGIFSAAQKFVSISLSLLIIAFNVIYPYVIKNREKESIISKMYIALSFILFVVNSILVPYLVSLFIEHSIDEISLYILYLSPMVLFFGLRLAFGQLYFLVRKKESIYSKVVVFTSIVGFALSWIVIGQFFTLGAAIVMNLVNVIMVALIIYNKKLGRKLGENSIIR